jgi:hypothetical protein
MKWEGDEKWREGKDFRREDCDLFESNIPTFTWRDYGISRKLSDRITGSLDEIQTLCIQNTNLERIVTLTSGVCPLVYPCVKVTHAL